MNTTENNLQYVFNYMEANPKSTVYGPVNLRELIENARKQEVDVSAYEEKLPELDKRFT